jgi:LysM domain-containing protein
MFVRILVISVLALLFWAAFARPSGGAGHERTYVVKNGDTLWSIAASNYGGDTRESVWRLEQRNGMAGENLAAGTRLILP